MHRTAVVIGAGLSGLSAAHRLQAAGWQVKVFEAGARIGGRTHTENVGGYLVDTGASALTSSYTDYLNLAGELGISSQIAATSPMVSIPRGGRIHALNIDHLFLSGVSTRLFSMREKICLGRLFTDAFIAKSRRQLNYSDMSGAAILDTESVADYANRRLDGGLLDYFCDPLTRMMLIANADAISKVELLSAISNIVGARLLALQGGVGRFAQYLAAGISVTLNSPAELVESSADGVAISIRTSNGQIHTENADTCVVSCDLDSATDICRGQRDLLGQLKQHIAYTCALTVALGFKKRPSTDSLVMLMPACESPEVALMFFDHNKCADRTPSDRFLINTHWENTASQKNLDRPDAELVEHTLDTVLRYFPEIANSLEMSHVARWKKALPLTRPGAYKAIAAFNRALSPSSRIQFAADYMSAAGQNTAVSVGERAAKNLINHFGNFRQ